MGGFSDIFYPDNPKRRQNVRLLCEKISTDIKFIEKTVNDSLEKCNEYLKEKTPLVYSYGKTVNQFLWDVQAAFEETDRAAHAQYKELSTQIEVGVDTAAVERAREKVGSLDLEKMREGFKELEILGFSWDIAAMIVASMTVTFVAQALASSCGTIIANIGGLAAGALVGFLVTAITDVLSGAMERAEMERRIRELTNAEQVIRENSNAIADSAKKLYDALVMLDILRQSGDE